jgi:hypothetical protein
MLVENVSSPASLEESDSRTFAESLTSTLEKVSSAFDPNSKSPFTALIEFIFKTDDEPAHPGDNRVLYKLEIKHTLPME